MKVLFIGGTGNISTEASKLAVKNGIDLFLITRGKNKNKIKGANHIKGDINNPKEIYNLLKNKQFDSIVNWIVYSPEEIKRDIKLFKDITKQYIFISTASAYQKPLTNPIITESTPLLNPFWEYSQKKIACENILMKEYINTNFPCTIVRPSHTYSSIFPIAIGHSSSYTIPNRILSGKKVIIHGDGTSLWTLTHSVDFAKGFVGLLGNPKTIGHSFHITSDEHLTWNQIYQTISNALGVKANIIHIPSDFINEINPNLGARLLGDKSHSVIFDNSKIKSYVPQFKATIDFHEGLKRTINWFKENSNLKSNIESDKEIDTIIEKYEKKFN